METGDFDCEDYVSEWTDWEGVDMNELLAIHKVCILNKTQYAGSLSLNDYAHKITDKKDTVMNNYDEKLYAEIVKDSTFSYGKFNENKLPYTFTTTLTMNKPELPPILNTKEYESLVEKYKQEEERQRQYCYKPYRTLHNY